MFTALLITRSGLDLRCPIAAIMLIGGVLTSMVADRSVGAHTISAATTPSPTRIRLNIGDPRGREVLTQLGFTYPTTYESNFVTGPADSERE